MVTNAWRQQGISFGIGLGILHIFYVLLNNLAPASATLNNVLNVSLPITLILCGVAGFNAAKILGSMKAGIYAGVLTGLLGMAIGIVSLFLVTFAFMDTIRHNAFMIADFHRSGLESMDQFIIDDALGASFFGTMASLVFGGVVGAAGGYLGVRSKDDSRPARCDG